MFFILILNLYISRLVLNYLGVIDYGVYNIVGGVIVLFSFLNGAMTSATQRFLSYEIGSGTPKKVNEVFSICITSHLLIAFGVVILGETLGLWFLHNYINIPAERMSAAIFTYHFSIFSFCFGIIQIPYSSIIIAYEKMNTYAIVTIIDAVLKLSVAMLLSFSVFDRLKQYSFSMFMVHFIVLLLYFIIIKINYKETKYCLFWDKKRYFEIFSFSGWSVLGGAANISVNQGISIVLNLFYGVIANTAVGIANQVTTAVYSFVTNFQTAFKPQIIKYYASKNYTHFYSLLFRASKFSYYLIFIIALPVLLCTEGIFKLWLGQVPEYAVVFCKLIIVNRIIDSISGPLWMAVQATGNIKKYQIIVSSIILMNLVFSYLFLKMGFAPHVVYIVSIFINIILLIYRIIFLHYLVQLPIKNFCTEVLFKLVIVTILSIPIPLLIRLNLDVNSILNVFIISFVSLLMTLIFIYVLGLEKTERVWLHSINPFKNRIK